METPLIMLQNITLAVRAKNILEKAGIRGYVQKTPRTNNRANCGYSVFVPDETDTAERILKDKGFVVLGRAGRLQQ